MTYDQHWEPPEPTKLLITTHRLAEILNVPLWQAYDISHSLDRIYYGPGESRFRITMASVRAFQQLLEQGLNHSQAREIMYRAKTEPPAPIRRPALSQPAQRRRFGRSRRWG